MLSSTCTFSLIPTSQQEVMRLPYLWDLFPGSHLWCNGSDPIRCRPPQQMEVIPTFWISFGFVVSSDQHDTAHSFHAWDYCTKNTAWQNRQRGRAGQQPELGTLKPSACHQWLHLEDWDQTTRGGHRWASHTHTHVHRSGSRFKLLCSIVILLMSKTDSASLQKTGNGGWR